MGEMLVLLRTLEQYDPVKIEKQTTSERQERTAYVVQ